MEAETKIRQAILENLDLPNHKIAKLVTKEGFKSKAADVAKQRAVLDEAGATDDWGILTVDAASLVLGVSRRRVRAICQEGRLGKRLGARVYAIARPELVEFARRSRPSGTAGVQAYAEEMEASA